MYLVLHKKKPPMQRICLEQKTNFSQPVFPVGWGSAIEGAQGGRNSQFWPQALQWRQQNWPSLGKPCVFSSKISIHVPNAFMEYSPKYESAFWAKFIFVGGSILTLARLDAFVAIMITLLSSDETGKVGEHCQKLNYDIFVLVFLKTFDRLMSTIRIFI